MSEHCPGCGIIRTVSVYDCPGVTCPTCDERERQHAIWGVYPCEQCAAKNQEVAEKDAKLKEWDVIYKYGCDLVAQRDAEIARLRALVAVGREMAGQCYIRVEESKNTEECSVCILCGDGTEDHSEKHTELCPVGKWRSLEGEGR